MSDHPDSSRTERILDSEFGLRTILTGTQLTKLPRRLEVGSYITITDTRITELPDDLQAYGVVIGNREMSIPGSISGTEFNSQFTAAVQKIYKSGHSKPLVFSQGTAIMLWTLMNAKNSRAESSKESP